MKVRLFPVLEGDQWRQYRAANMPRFVPWSMLAEHDDQAFKNHHQDLGRLAERGGLDASEILAVLEGRRWSAMPVGQQVSQLRAAMLIHEELMKGRALAAARGLNESDGGDGFAHPDGSARANKLTDEYHEAREIWQWLTEERVK